MVFCEHGFSFAEFFNLKEVVHLLSRRNRAKIALVFRIFSFISPSPLIVKFHPVHICLSPRIHLGIERDLNATRPSPRVPGRPWPLQTLTLGVDQAPCLATWGVSANSGAQAGSS